MNPAATGADMIEYHGRRYDLAALRSVLYLLRNSRQYRNCVRPRRKSVRAAEIWAEKIRAEMSGPVHPPQSRVEKNCF